ncbi:MAG: hypothetical protein GYB28_01475 [Gammaproteobacteria bacterium]|nr:hypothetical protein [Gammaproteobacteria bacterium]
MSAAEQLLAENNVKIAELIKEAQRWRDASAGLNAVYPTVTEGRQSVADGKYFSVPGNGAYMRLYRRQGASAELIAEFPDRNELNSVIDQLGPLLGRGVTGGWNNLGNGGELVRLVDAPFASRAHFGRYNSGGADQNIDQAPVGECALYSTGNPGIFPQGASTFYWVETQRTYSGEALVQIAYPYGSASYPSHPLLKASCWIRICSNSRDGEGNRVWGDWAELLTLDTLFKSIESGGGIERGSNTSGSYTKYADGRLVCWGHVEHEVSITETGLVANSAWRRSPTSIHSFPREFISRPSVNFTQSYLDASPAYFDIFPSQFTIPANANTKFGLIYTSPGVITNRLVRTAWTAEGFWK